MTLLKKDLIATRDFNENDKSFIMATWLRGLRYGNDWFLAIDSTAYFKTYHRVLEQILSSPNETIKIACLKDDPDVILGYCVFKRERLDWLFVKKAWRGIGIAKQLIPSDIKVVTHITTVGRSILNKSPHIIFNPFSLD